MRLAVRTIGLILLGSFPAGVSAQWAPQPDRSSSNGAVPAAYQQVVPPRQTAYANTASSANASMPLKPRVATDDAESDRRPNGLQSALTVAGSLAAVLGVFFLIVWVLRRASPAMLGTLPAEVFETLGRTPLGHHQQAHLVRCGNKLLLVSVGAAGVETLSEITDPEEVDRLTDLCRRARPSSPTAALRRVFGQVEERHA